MDLHVWTLHSWHFLVWNCLTLSAKRSAHLCSDTGSSESVLDCFSSDTLAPTSDVYPACLHRRIRLLATRAQVPDTPSIHSRGLPFQNKKKHSNPVLDHFKTEKNTIIQHCKFWYCNMIRAWLTEKRLCSAWPPLWPLWKHLLMTNMARSCFRLCFDT